MIRTLATTCLSTAMLCSLVGCGPKHDGDRSDQNATTSPASPAPSEAATPTAAPTATPTTKPFTGPGIQLAYGGGWRTANDPDYALMLVPDGGGKTSDVSVSVEVPKLPPHIPGMIPLGSVVNGYVDDMKKQHAGVHVAPPATRKVAGANARRVMSSWTTGGKEFSEEAILTVRSDRVYIFRANADEPNRQRATHALNELLNSVQWR
jgi:hypothetical protein